MNEVRRPHDAGQEGDTLTDPTTRAAWLADVRAQTADIIAAGLDATAPPGERDLGRREARRIIREAGGALASRLAEAGAPLPGGAP